MSLGDDGFIVHEDPVEQERFKRRLIANTKSPKKKKKQQLQPDQDLLTDRWTEVLEAENTDSSAQPKVTQSAGCYLNSRRRH